MEHSDVFVLNIESRTFRLTTRIVCVPCLMFSLKLNAIFKALLHAVGGSEKRGDGWILENFRFIKFLLSISVSCAAHVSKQEKPSIVK